MCNVSDLEFDLLFAVLLGYSQGFQFENSKIFEILKQTICLAFNIYLMYIKNNIYIEKSYIY